MTAAIEVCFTAGRPPVVPVRDGDDPAGWLAVHRNDVAAVVSGYGAALIRGLGVRDVAGAASASRLLVGELMSEREPFAPRSAHPPLYSSTVWPADQPMCMHHELSYALQCPSRLVFCCLTALDRGGATALADAAAVLRDLPPQLVDRFTRTGWQLLRTHNDIVGVPWPEAFGSTDRATVERYCRDNDIAWRWDDDGGLRTRRVRPAVIDHPVTGEPLWCNQIAFLNEWTMEPAVREYLTFEFGADGLPFNTRYGDGQPLDKATVDLINDVYAAHTVREPWRDGDILVVDNLRMAHAREPYEGERHVVVALADPVPLAPAAQSKASDRYSDTSGLIAEQARTVAATRSG